MLLKLALDQALLRLPLRFDARLRVDLKCPTTAGVTHQFLEDLHIFAIGSEQRRKGVAKRVPSDSLGYSRPQGGGSDDLTNHRIGPERVLPLRMRACENPVVSLLIRTCLPPQSQISGHAPVQGNRLLRCLRLTIANLPQINGTQDVTPQAREINVAPF